MASTAPISLVTGANKGIGFFIAKGLLGQGHKVLLACRDANRANEALSKLAEGLTEEKKNNLLGTIPFDLDYSSPEDFQKSAAAARSLIGEGGKFTAVVHNAGFAFKTDSTTPFPEQAKVSNKLNYFGTQYAVEAFLPLMAEGSRIVLVGSRAGFLSGIKSQEIKKQFSSDTLTIPQLDALINQFIDLTAKDQHRQAGWPNTAYGVSKMGVNTYARVMARDPRLKTKGITINSCCPGYCATDMSSWGGSRSAEEGAETPIFLATNSQIEGATGGFYGECIALDLVNDRWF